MKLILYSVLTLVLLALILVATNLRRKNNILSSTGQKTKKTAMEPADQECCGQHEVCEKKQLLRAMRQKIEYFDDEELDRYKGTPSNDYTDEQVEEFREVLETMRQSEVDDWLKSLELREVALPDALKDEVYLLLKNR